MVVLGALSPFLLGWLSFAPNRLLSPRPAPLPWSAGTVLGAFCFLGFCVVSGFWVRRPETTRRAEIAVALAACALLATVGVGAAVALEGAAPLARAAPAPGTWCSLFLLILTAGSCAARRRGVPALFLATMAVGVFLLASGGVLAPLSLVREAASRAAEIGTQSWRHINLAGSALLLALVAAVPLSLWALSRPRVEAALIAAASMFQVIPTIALFGLLMAPLGQLANRWPGLRDWGIGGIGPAPAILGMAAYLLLPLASAILAGLRVATPQLIDAAKGQGLSPGAILRHVRLPLGLGVILGGLRVAAVQAIGLATLAALIGGGGLGSLVFQGIGQLAADLILLGVMPVVGLSVAVDGMLAAAQSRLEHRHDPVR